jgi:hypothetical protein
METLKTLLAGALPVLMSPPVAKGWQLDKSGVQVSHDQSGLNGPGEVLTKSRPLPSSLRSGCILTSSPAKAEGTCVADPPMQSRKTSSVPALLVIPLRTEAINAIATQRYHCRMAASATTRVEIDTDLLGQLRKRRPERSDRELLESAARIQLRREAIGRVRKRFAGVPMEEIESEAVKAVREVRREHAAERRAAG